MVLLRIACLEDPGLFRTRPRCAAGRAARHWRCGAWRTVTLPRAV